jgi:hypothetical protein
VSGHAVLDLENAFRIQSGANTRLPCADHEKFRAIVDWRAVALEAAPAALITVSAADRERRRVRALSATASSFVASPAHGGAGSATEHPLTGPEFAKSVNLARNLAVVPLSRGFFEILAGPANKKSYAAVIAGTAAVESPSIAAGSIGSRSRSKQRS